MCQPRPRSQEIEAADVGAQCIDCYVSSAGADVVSQLRELAAPLSGARVLHLNATPYGGGVAEILRSEVPLLRDLGLAADWQVIAGDAAFFNVTKAIHNGLQGAQRELAAAEQSAYVATAARNVAQLNVTAYDVIIVHDPQPLALLRQAGKGTARWVWRCHIDTSEPHLPVWAFPTAVPRGLRRGGIHTGQLCATGSPDWQGRNHSAGD